MRRGVTSHFSGSHSTFPSHFAGWVSFGSYAKNEFLFIFGFVNFHVLSIEKIGRIFDLAKQLAFVCIGSAGNIHGLRARWSHAIVVVILFVNGNTAGEGARGNLSGWRKVLLHIHGTLYLYHRATEKLRHPFVFSTTDYSHAVIISFVYFFYYESFWTLTDEFHHLLLFYWLKRK